MLAKTWQCKTFPFSLAMQGCASPSLKAAQSRRLSAGHFGFGSNFLNLNFLVFLPLSSLFWWWSSAVYFSQSWACLAPSAPWGGAGGKSSCATRSTAALCPLQPFWTGSLGTGSADTGDEGVDNVEHFNKQPEGSSSSLLWQGTGTPPLAFQPASGCGCNGFYCPPRSIHPPLASGEFLLLFIS